MSDKLPEQFYVPRARRLKDLQTGEQATVLAVHFVVHEDRTLSIGEEIDINSKDSQGFRLAHIRKLEDGTLEADLSEALRHGIVFELGNLPPLGRQITVSRLITDTPEEKAL